MVNEYDNFEMEIHQVAMYTKCDWIWENPASTHSYKYL